MTELLKETTGVGPKLVIPQGDRVAVLVARDIDFGSVYTGETHGRDPAQGRAD